MALVRSLWDELPEWIKVQPGQAWDRAHAREPDFLGSGMSIWELHALGELEADRVHEERYGEGWRSQPITFLGADDPWDIAAGFAVTLLVGGFLIFTVGPYWALAVMVFPGTMTTTFVSGTQLMDWMQAF